ncbi:MAG TPA: glycine--tRNA ligase [Rhodospirillaceae bacterium]|nr:glycine--tRNA ligase [Rhodospirillaceae bacterium]
MSKAEASLMNRIVSLSKRRGFIYQASEIYGGLGGFWDFGPLGVQLKNNLRDAWWHSMVECPPMGPDGKPLSIVGLDSSIIQHPRTWQASGHAEGFADMMVDCRETKSRYRADHVICARYLSADAKISGYISGQDGDNTKDQISKKADKLGRKKGIKFDVDLSELIPLTSIPVENHGRVIGPDASKAGTLTDPRAFNLMFESHYGVLQTDETKVYLRPETAQGIFLQYKNILDTSRVRPPFGVAQVGKSFRNEVTPRNFIFRSREFEQMEMEFFCPPEDGMMWYEFWVNERMRWWEEVAGCKKENLFAHVIPEDEIAHYSKGTTDIEYRWPFTEPNFGELEGVAYRTDYDLKQHAKFSKTKLDYIDQESKERYVPHVVEPASGLTRGVLLLLCEAYQYDESRPSPEWLKIKPSLAPTKLGIFPLMNKDGMPELAEKLYMDLRQDYTCQYDPKQSIGKRYARMDEAGTPYCITVDGETLKDQAVTVRDRDTASQERVAIDKVREYVGAKLS